MASPPDYYRILGIRSNASPVEILRAFRQKAMEVHPDRNPAPDANERFKEVKEAYETLSDPERRARYDANRAPQSRARAVPRTRPIDWDALVRTYHEQQAAASAVEEAERTIEQAAERAKAAAEKAAAERAEREARRAADEAAAERAKAAADKAAAERAEREARRAADKAAAERAEQAARQAADKAAAEEAKAAAERAAAERAAAERAERTPEPTSRLDIDYYREHFAPISSPTEERARAEADRARTERVKASARKWANIQRGKQRRRRVRAFLLQAAAVVSVGAAVGVLFVFPLLPDDAAAQVIELQQRVSELFG